MQREEHQHRGDAGDRQRQHQNVYGERPHRLAQRRFVENDFEEVAAHRRGSHHAYHVARLASQQRIERVDDRLATTTLPHVDVLRDLGRHIGSGEQAALIAHLHRHGARADAFQNLVRQAFRHHAARCGIEHERRCVRGGKPIVQPVQAEICDRRHVNQNFRHHHEQDGEQQQLAGRPTRAASAPAAAPPNFAAGPLPASKIASTEDSHPANDAPHPRTGQTWREKIDGCTFSEFRQRRIWQHDVGESADIQALRDRQVHIAINSPACAPTIVAPTIVPFRVVMTFM